MWYEIGIGLVVLGSVSGGLGFNLISKSSRTEVDQPLWRRPLLATGLFLSTVVNTAMDLISYALVPLSTIAPLGGVAIVAAAGFSALGISGEKEPITKAKVLGIGCVVSGIAAVSVFGPRPASTILDVGAAFHAFAAPPFFTYNITTLCALCAVFIGVGGDLLPEFSIVRTVLCSIVAGMSSAVCQSLIKLMATCLADYSVHHGRPWRQPLFPLTLFELAVVGGMLFVLIKLTIENADLAFGTSMYTVAVMIFTIVAGSDFYGEFEDIADGNLAAFCVGVVVITAGIVVLSRSPPRSGKRRIPVSKTEDDPATLPPVDPDGEIIE